MGGDVFYPIFLPCGFGRVNILLGERQIRISPRVRGAHDSVFARLPKWGSLVLSVMSGMHPQTRMPWHIFHPSGLITLLISMNPREKILDEIGGEL